jgi:hypothetical protein
MSNLFHSNRSRSILVACTLTTSALLGSGVAQANTCRPWHVELSAQLSNVIYYADGNLRYAEATGSGNASYIGAFSMVGVDYFHLPANGMVEIDGDAIFTGSNGDQIFVNFDGSAIDVTTGVGGGTYVFTGGRGRFEDATGHASFSGFLNPDGFTVVGDGILCY